MRLVIDGFGAFKSRATAVFGFNTVRAAESLGDKQRSTDIFVYTSQKRLLWKRMYGIGTISFENVVDTSASSISTSSWYPSLPHFSTQSPPFSAILFSTSSYIDYFLVEYNRSKFLTF